MELHEKIVELVEKYLGRRIDDHDEVVEACVDYLDDIGLDHHEDLDLKNLLSLVIVHRGDRPSEVFTGEVSSVFSSDTPNRIIKGKDDPLLHPSRNRGHRKYFDEICEACLKLDSSISFSYNKTGMSVKKKGRTKFRLDNTFLMDDRELVSTIMAYTYGSLESFEDALPYKVVRARTVGLKSRKDPLPYVSNVPHDEIIEIINEVYLGIGDSEDDDN